VKFRRLRHTILENSFCSTDIHDEKRDTYFLDCITVSGKSCIFAGRHSYILELKYLKTDATEAEAERQWAEAAEQICSYAEGTRVRKLTRDTQLHLIVMQVKGCEMLRTEEITLAHP
jgi:hypothetical protein